MHDEIDELLRHYGAPIEKFLKDAAVTEISVNTWEEVYIEREGRKVLTEAHWRDEMELVNFIQQIGRNLGQDINEDNPRLAARLPDGTRVDATLAPIAIRGSTISFRPYPKTQLTIEDLVRFGAVTPPMVRLFRVAVAKKLNIVIAGGTGSGKTTLLRCFSYFFEPAERVLTAEDTAENIVPAHPHVVSFEAPKRRATEGVVPITMGMLIEDMLRKFPDRIVVGEIRTPEAAAAFIDAINTGHSGTLGTVHANNCLDTLKRIEMLYARQALNFTMDIVQETVRSNVNFIVHAAREYDDTQGRHVRRIREIMWVNDGQPVRLLWYRKGHGFCADDAAIVRFDSAMEEF